MAYAQYFSLTLSEIMRLLALNKWRQAAYLLVLCVLSTQEEVAEVPPPACT